jgi:hypothetical protein
MQTKACPDTGAGCSVVRRNETSTDIRARTCASIVVRNINYRNKNGLFSRHRQKNAGELMF